MKALVVVGLLASLAASGCTLKDTQADAGTRVSLGDGNTVELAPVENTAVTGSISGVVVDDAIRPLAGVNVSLPDGTAAKTDAGGLFTFGDLDPGTYFLSVRPTVVGATRYLGIQTTADVAAGETAKVRIVLPTDPVPMGYHSTLKFDGFYQASSGFVDEILDLYVYNQTYGPVTTPPNPGCTCRWDVSADANVSTFVAELLWEEPQPGNPAPEFWTLQLSSENGSAPLYFCDGGSPCNAHFEQSGNFSGNDRAFSIAVWTDPSWVYVNQKFQLFTTLFYLEAAPPDWSFAAGDA